MRRHPQIPLKINCLLQEPEKRSSGSGGSGADTAGSCAIYRGYADWIRPADEIREGRTSERTPDETLRHADALRGCAGEMGPAVYFSLEGFQGKIGFISAVSHKFCNSCNRVRLTSDGFLKTCLQYDTGVRLKEPMQAGCSDEELAFSDCTGDPGETGGTRI